jgi:hypothetical protein
MNETPSWLQFSLSPQQRRLRTVTAVVLVVILLMIVFGMTSPFFHPARPAVLTPRLQKALTVRILFIGSYWIVCTLLACSLIVLAWLDLREVRRKLSEARRDMWKDILERSRERKRGSSQDE